MDGLKLTKTILALLCSDESESLDAILPALLKLANNMLNCSVKKVQDQFYKELESNKNSEKLFDRMFTAINRNIFIYRWHTKKFAMTNKKKVFQSIAKIDIQREILLFIRALCNKHHEGLQDFMLEQKHYRTCYDMIKLLVNYLETLVKEIKVINDRDPSKITPEDAEKIPARRDLCYEHSKLALKALTETIQGANKRNQEAIADSGFLVTANAIFELNFVFGDSRESYSSCYFSNHQLCRIKNECAVLLLSLLEQRYENDQIVVKMRQFVKEDALIFNISFVYYTFTLEVDRHYDAEFLFDDNEETNSNFLLMLGFNSLFLLKKWMELYPGHSSIPSNKAVAELKELLDKASSNNIVAQAHTRGIVKTVSTFFVDLVTGVMAFFKSTFCTPGRGGKEIHAELRALRRTASDSFAQGGRVRVLPDVHGNH